MKNWARQPGRYWPLLTLVFSRLLSTILYGISPAGGAISIRPRANAARRVKPRPAFNEWLSTKEDVRHPISQAVYLDRNGRPADLKGLGPVPGIAGRSPSYLVRQLYDMQ
ncbi:MAG: hypothetical protein M3Y24_11115 [Acidobacteriota bacterium]|nr:hypothetical protein [Acidobacteriota bacterium]